ncbi:serine hydrolase [Vibrio mediterranei]|uniref:Beta-lactamase-related domain-containing protein n=1 Tax=Vibrio mediterranei TaxID=689 RepID=A0AAN1KQ22_9VIBR|nr:serine hydrolase [Vibrio mediterranei]ASI92097.1 hypothetical protein BSZ05_19985 [Vibrio mediterranei]
MKAYLLPLIVLGGSIQPVVAANDASQNTTTFEYIDDSRGDYLSGWKALLTNSQPDKLLENGTWFDASPSPRPLTYKQGNRDLPAPFKKQLKANNTDGLMVLQGGTVVSEYYRYGFNANQIHLIHSTGKAYTSFACQDVYDQKKQQVMTVPIAMLVPETEGLHAGNATTEQALNMTLATKWSENYEDPNSHTMLSGKIGGWDPIPKNEQPQTWSTLYDTPVLGEHGKVWSYNSVSVILASKACAALAEKDFSELVQSSYDKLGFEDASWYVSNTFGELSAEGGQAMTMRDFVKLGLFMLENDDSTYVQDIWNADGTTAKLMKGYDFVQGYKNYWFKLSDDVIVAIGSSGQLIYVDKSKDIVIGKFSSFEKGQDKTSFKVALKLLKDIAEHYQ